MKPLTSIHRNDAVRLLSDGHAHRLRLWKLSTGDILTYEHATLMGRHVRGGSAKVRLHPSGEVRQLRLVCLFEIDGLSIYW